MCKVRVASDAVIGAIVDMADRVLGPTADSTLVARSGLLARLPPGVGARADLGYPGLDKPHAQGATAPRRISPTTGVRPTPHPRRAYHRPGPPLPIAQPDGSPSSLPAFLADLGRGRVGQSATAAGGRVPRTARRVIPVRPGEGPCALHIHCECYLLPAFSSASPRGRASSL